MSNLQTVLRHVRLQRTSASGHTYFREGLVGRRVSRGALATSLFAHAAVFVFPLPARWFSEALEPPPESRVELTWTGSARDLPLIFPRREPAKPVQRSAAPKNTPKPEEIPAPPKAGGELFHPRQLIVSAPARPSHPRQTLVQPDAPAVPPKILPPLPNIVEWGESARPAKPRLTVDPRALAKLRPRRNTPQRVVEPAIPVVPNLERNVGELSIAASTAHPIRPKLAVRPMSAPRFRSAARLADSSAGSAAPAPEIAPGAASGDTAIKRLIALSAAPAEPTPTVEVPPGNLAARFVLAPNLGVVAPAQASTASGAAGPDRIGAGLGSVGAGDPSGNGIGGMLPLPGGGNGTGPSFLSISGASPAPTSTVAGGGGASRLGGETSPASPIVLPAKPEARLKGVEAGRGPGPDSIGAGSGNSSAIRPGPAAPRSSPSALDRIQAGFPPEEVLLARRVYTLHVNMPNLSSVTGSWILSFAEMGGGQTADAGLPTPGDELQGPVPLRKVDPAYPPALAGAGVQGEVVLYAIIRRDGSVDSIQVVKKLEPQLDRNAMEALSRWQFRPAERKGEPVELEAVVHIPFRTGARF